jgi:hypothetical protein
MRRSGQSVIRAKFDAAIETNSDDCRFHFKIKQTNAIATAEFSGRHARLL